MAAFSKKDILNLAQMGYKSQEKGIFAMLKGCISPTAAVKMDFYGWSFYKTIKMERSAL
jgi:hypothetical protein